MLGVNVYPGTRAEQGDQVPEWWGEGQGHMICFRLHLHCGQVGIWDPDGLLRLSGRLPLLPNASEKYCIVHVLNLLIPSLNCIFCLALEVAI